MSFKLLTPLAATIVAYSIPPAADFSPEILADIKNRIGQDHGVIVRENGVEGDSVSLVFLGENGKYVASTGQTVVFVRNSEVEVYADDSKLGERYEAAAIPEQAPDTDDANQGEPQA